MHPLTPTAAADLARDGAPCGPAADIDPARLVSDLRAGGQLRDDLRAAVEAHAADCRTAVAAGKSRPTWGGGSLSGADLSAADLSAASFYAANIIGANLSAADLSGVNFYDADLSGADLSNADLSNADLSNANLGNADLSNANIIGANFRSAVLNGTDLSGAIVPEGAVVAVIVGEAGGYRWHAFAIDTGGCILRYGCDRATLAVWQARGPEYGDRHGHGPKHWATGPAVAIDLAEAMMAELGAR